MRLFERTLPRFFVPLFLVTAVVLCLGLFILSNHMRKLLYRLKRQESPAVLENVMEVVAEYHRSLEDYRKLALEDRKSELRHIVELALSVVKKYHNLVLSGAMKEEAAQEEAKRVLSYMRYGDGDYIFVIDNSYHLIVHPDPKLKGVSLYNLRDVNGVYIIRDLVRAAKDASGRGFGYVRYYWSKYSGSKRLGRVEPKLSVAAYFGPWEWTIGTGVYISDIEDQVENKKEEALERLRSKLRNMKLGKYGYVFIFDSEGRIIYHPVLKPGFNIIKAKAIDHSTGRLMYDELVEASRRPWGDNVLEYLWDRPDDRGHYVYPKIAWCAKEPLTGWYVAISAYKSEVESAAKPLMKGMMWTTSSLVIILFFAMFMLLKKLLAPVESMVAACKKIEKEGDLSVRVAEDIPGDMGLLAKSMNRMIEAMQNFNRRLETKVRERTNELLMKTKELEEANERLKELDRAKSAFLSSVSHELRTPLTSILGFAKLIHKDFTKSFAPLAEGDRKLQRRAKRVEENLAIIIKEGERLTRLINDVLDLSKIESGRIQWRDTKFSMAEAISDAVKAVSGQIVQKPQVKLEVEIEDGMPEIYADRDRILQVLVNLLNNAIKFTDSGCVKVKAHSTNGSIRVAVEDTGCGIPKEDLEKVFDKFHQVVRGDTLKDKPSGTGLGLAICKQIIEHYGGRIWVESELGKGSTFFFEIPVEEEKKASNVDGRSEISKRKKPLILVVDDDQAVREFLRQLFENAGYNVEIASNGKEALEKAKKLLPDLITIDLMMPVMDGRKAVSLIRQDPKLSKVPIVVISVLPESHKGSVGDFYIEKPVDEERLLEVVGSLIMDQKRYNGACLVVEDGKEVEEKLVLLCPSEVYKCRKEELKKKIEEGFVGTVIIPHALSSELDLDEMISGRDIQEPYP